MKTIQLDKHYQNVNGIQLKPGIHELQDNLAAYLVDNGHAVDVTPVASEPAIAIGGTITSSSWTDVPPDTPPAPKANKRK